MKRGHDPKPRRGDSDETQAGHCLLRDRPADGCRRRCLRRAGTTRRRRSRPQRSRADAIVSAISATGTVEPVTTVEVGSQVTGTIDSLGADFNSIVKKGQVLARLDPSTRAEQRRAGARQLRPRQRRCRSPPRVGRGRGAEAGTCARPVVAAIDSGRRPGRRNRDHPGRRGTGALGGSRRHTGARLAAPGAGQPREDRHHVADRRHRHRPKRRRRTDRLRESVGAHAVRDRRRHVLDAD